MNFKQMRGNALSRRARARTFCGPQLEALERRCLRDGSNPLNTSTFENHFQNLLENYDLAQRSIAVIQNGHFGTKKPPTPTPSSLFRLASISKTFTAMAVLKLAQDDRVRLNSSALEDLGYRPGEKISGRNPITGARVSVTLDDPELFRLTVQNLLQMTSGFEYNIPLASEAFPSAGSGDLTTTVAGNYAALGFAGVPKGGHYNSPATTRQLINYSVFKTATDPDLQVTAPGTTFYYDNLDYVMLGLLVADRSGSKSPTPAGKYMDYINREILRPLRIAPATDSSGSAENAPAASVGLASTFQNTQYLNEVNYYQSGGPKLVRSVVPAATPYKKTLLPSSSTCVPEAYGSTDLQSNFGDAGLVATPTALAIVMNNLSQVYAGTATGPLTQAMVRGMVSEPTSQATNGESDNEVDFGFGPGFFGMGLGVSPRGDSKAAWTKDGDLTGTSTFFERYPDGTVFAATFNSRATNTSYRNALENIISQVFYKPPVANGYKVSAVAGEPLTMRVLAEDSDPNPDGNLNPASVTIPHNDYPNHGTISIDPNAGVITYDADKGYAGTDQFTYEVSDDFDLNAEATVKIEVT
jgi:CubicO group peptidase (beta-lactamase class C family)